MYSGITRGLHPIVSVQPRSGVTGFEVELPETLREGLSPGASVAVDGVCLTVVSVRGARVGFDAAAETLGRTTLGELREGRRVSIERSVKAGDELGGHDVYGHVLGTATVSERAFVGEQLDLALRCPPEWMKYILHKGFIALDGSSLTVDAPASSGGFRVHLIPETLRITGLGQKQVGQRVNVELDPRTVAIVDTVERVLAERGVR